MKKRQHFVHQGYFRPWLNREDYLHVLDVEGGDVYTTGTSNIAVRGYFYDPPGHEPVVEEALADLDARSTAAQREVLAKVDRVLGGEFSLVPEVLAPEQKVGLAVSMAMQIARTPSAREFLAVEEEGEARLAHLEFMTKGGVQALAAELLEYVWIVGLNPTGMPLYTSDNPVFPSAPVPDAPQVGFPRPAQFVYPLSPYCLLWLWEPSWSSEKVAWDGHAVVAMPEDVEEANRRQVLGTHRQLISITGDFSFARQVLAEREPVLASPEDADELILGPRLGLA